MVGLIPIFSSGNESNIADAQRILSSSSICGTQIAFRHVTFGEGGFAFGDVAIAAAGDCVGVIVGKGLAELARVEAEHPALIVGGRLLAQSESLSHVDMRIFATAHLYRRTPAVPPIGRHERVPKRRRRRKRDTVERRMGGAHLGVARRAVLGDRSGHHRLLSAPIARPTAPKQRQSYTQPGGSWSCTVFRLIEHRLKTYQTALILRWRRPSTGKPR